MQDPTRKLRERIDLIVTINTLSQAVSSNGIYLSFLLVPYSVVSSISSSVLFHFFPCIRCRNALYLKFFSDSLPFPLCTRTLSYDLIVIGSSWKKFCFFFFVVFIICHSFCFVNTFFKKILNFYNFFHIPLN